MRHSITKPAPLLILLLVGLLSGCTAARPLPVPAGTQGGRAEAVSAAAGNDLPALPGDLFEPREDLSPEPSYAREIEGQPITNPASNERILAIARQFVGIPYRRGGVSPAGFDCSGLVYYVYRQAGISVPRTSASQHQAAQIIDLKDLRPGDLLFFKIKPQRISHVGIFVEGDLFLHATSTGKNVTFSRLDEPYWKKRLAGAGRFAVDGVLSHPSQNK